MRNTPWIILFLFFFLGAGLIWTRPVTADFQNQVSYQTPTARPDGRVVYIVKEGDDCTRIYLLTGVTIEQLIALNRLDQACTLMVGKELLLAVITPQPSPTANPNITPTPLLPTPTPYNGNGQVCVQLFNDINGDATREDNELPLAGGAVSISD
ncbi:MAG: LysM peptidoglycan-binding domain-containing protein, partial [Anaerolineaceae bacterium]|nr:LysM peptidoglycan-binding domain-containing protein [Anaerolineaceae bacterium]